jgi:hypothetical protein
MPGNGSRSLGISSPRGFSIRRSASGAIEKDFQMLKFIGGTVGVIFLIGLLVVIGILALIF